MDPAFLKLLDKEPATTGEWFEALITLIRFLRSPEGCPWDREQTALDYARFCVEEGEELQEALLSGDNEHGAEECGDCMFTFLACAVASEEEGRFSIQEALKGVCAKMVRRHAHVFGKERATTSEEVLVSWQKIKEQEKAEKEKQREETEE
ncbi:MAG: nucleotide pyrophosphohydrolase [Candidatus Hydrogenedens sp.]|jgi:tetrapyrrole methylase family protein/MazG family protein|nr:nucleotide pyrophosphohydrolase [Candidatus Hydrogenedens sp.]